MQNKVYLFPPLTAGVLAGGEGLRLGGADKGLLLWRGLPLVQQVLMALVSQSAEQLISANRNLETYAALGVRVLPDVAGHGPLAGLATLRMAASHDWLLCVPCDAPLLPVNLGAQLLHTALSAGASASYLHDGARAHPTFCLVHRSLAASACEAARQSTGLGAWLLQQGAVPCTASAPVNLNTAHDFAALQ